MAVMNSDEMLVLILLASFSAASLVAAGASFGVGFTHKPYLGKHEGGGGKIACHPACVNGSCSGKTGVCVCQSGWMGEACDVAVPPKTKCQAVNCGTHGACNEKTGLCVCDPLWTGKNCNQNVACTPPCVNGICADLATNKCLCNKGWTGSQCDQLIPPKDPCMDIDCGLHGTCADGKCKCAIGWEGDRCQTKQAGPVTDKCKSKVCINGGKCDSTTGNCVCPAPFTGEFCEKGGGPCDGVNCGNGGHCDPATGACVCPAGFIGNRCEIKGNCIQSKDCAAGKQCVHNQCQDPAPPVTQCAFADDIGFPDGDKCGYEVYPTDKVMFNKYCSFFHDHASPEDPSKSWFNLDAVKADAEYAPTLGLSTMQDVKGLCAKPTFAACTDPVKARGLSTVTQKYG